MIFSLTIVLHFASEETQHFSSTWLNICHKVMNTPQCSSKAYIVINIITVDQVLLCGKES